MIGRTLLLVAVSIMIAPTHPSAEEEIRLVFGEVGRIVTELFPHVFGDFDVIEEDGLPFYKPRNEKV